jgi:hypothetical protein
MQRFEPRLDRGNDFTFGRAKLDNVPQNFAQTDEAHVDSHNARPQKYILRRLFPH